MYNKDKEFEKNDKSKTILRNNRSFNGCN